MAWTWEIEAPTPGTPASIIDSPEQFRYTVAPGGILTVNLRFNIVGRDATGWINPVLVYTVDGGGQADHLIWARLSTGGYHTGQPWQACWNGGDISFCSTDEALAVNGSWTQHPFTYDNSGGATEKVIRLLGAKIDFLGAHSWNEVSTLQLEIVSASQPNEVEPEADPPPTVDVDIHDPTGVLLVTIARPLLCEWRHELNRAGSFELWLDRNDVQATAANLTPGNIVRITATEIDADPIFEGILETGDFNLISSDEEGGEILRFGGPGSFALLKYALLWHEDSLGFNDNPFLDEGVWRFTGVNQGANIIRRLINEAQGRTPAVIPDVTETFDQFDDSNGNLWDELDEEWTAPIGSDVLAETMKFVDAGEFDVRMDPGFILNAYRPGEMGTDRSSATFAAGKVRFVRGVNIADELVRGMNEQLTSSHVLIRTADSYLDFAAGMFPYRKEIFLDASQFESLRAALIAARRLAYGDRARDALVFTMRPPRTGEAPSDADGLYWPGIPGMTNAKFWLGDTVTIHTGTDETDYDNESMLVVGITFSRDPTGALAPPILELNAPVTDPDAPWGGASALPSGGLNGGGGGSSGTTFHRHDHGALPGLTDDDHPQYVLINEGSPVTVFAHGAMGATETFDPTNGSIHTGTLDANLIVTLNAPPSTRNGATAGALLELYFTQDGTGGRTVTWPGSVVWPGGVAPTVDTTAGTLTRYVFETLDGGTTWYGTVVGGGSEVTALDDLSDVTITAAAEGDLLRFNGSAWVNISPADIGLVGPILVSDTPAGSPLVFDDLLQNSDGTDLLYADV